MMLALVDNTGEALYSDGQMVVILTDEPEPGAALSTISTPGYHPLNAFIRRTIVHKRR